MDFHIASEPTPEEKRERALLEDEAKRYCYPHNFSEQLKTLCIPSETIFMPHDVALRLVNALYGDYNQEDFDFVVHWFGAQNWIGYFDYNKGKLTTTKWRENGQELDDYKFFPRAHVKFIRSAKDIGTPSYITVRDMLRDWQQSERMAEEICVYINAGLGLWFNHRPFIEDWHSSTEFRCYYKDGVGWRASYYDYYKPSGCKLYLMFADKLAASIYEFLEQVPVQDFGDKPTVIDIVMTVEGWKIIELNPGWLSDPCLFVNTELVPEANGLYLMDGSYQNLVKIDWPNGNKTTRAVLSEA